MKRRYFVSDSRLWTSLLTAMARFTGRVWFWYIDEDGHRHLYFGRAE